MISNCAVRSHKIVLRSHGLVIHSIELDNPFSRIAFLSFGLQLLKSRERERLSKSRKQFTIRENGLYNSKERIAQFDITIYRCYCFENPHFPSGLSYKPTNTVQCLYKCKYLQRAGGGGPLTTIYMLPYKILYLVTIIYLSGGRQIRHFLTWNQPPSVNL